MKKILMTMLAFVFTICMSINSFAGAWQQDAKGYWYVKDDGSYPTNTWMAIDGKEYYFGADGYMLVNTVTPDGFTVDASGAKTYITPAPAATQTTATQASVKQTSTGASSVQTVGAEVYVTQTGSKYHSKPNCGSSNPNTTKKVSLDTAESMGLDACKKCFK